MHNVFKSNSSEFIGTFTLNASYDTIQFENKLSVISIENGHGSLLLNGGVIALTSPMIICLNETDHLCLSLASDVIGEVFFFDPCTLKDYFTLENIRSLDYNFSSEDIGFILLLSSFINRHDNYAGFILTSEAVIHQLHKFIKNALHSVSDSNALSHKLHEVLIYISQLVTTYSRLSECLSPEYSFEVNDILTFLHNNYKQKITIPQLSKIFHVNRTTLSDRFFEATGETIITYLNKHRINLSAILLRESPLSVSDIAEEVGFNDTAYFAKLFKKYMRHTPSGYRQRYYSLSFQPKN